jgi:hypothetical protein
MSRFSGTFLCKIDANLLHISLMSDFGRTNLIQRVSMEEKWGAMMSEIGTILHPFCPMPEK